VTDGGIDQINRSIVGGMREPYYGWAIDAVDGLRWLAHVDEWAFAGHLENLGGRDPRIIDVAHVRWATLSAVTAIDLCAIEIAVQHGSVEFWSTHLPTFEGVVKMRETIPPGAKAWLDRVENDRDYQSLRRNARDPLTHRFMVRSALIGPGRTPFEIDPAAPPEHRPDARELILLSLDVADRHVAEFGRAVGGSTSPPPPRPA
jgi:hypothetical protein